MIEPCERLAAFEAPPAIIVLTAYSELDTAVKAFQLGALIGIGNASKSFKRIPEVKTPMPLINKIDGCPDSLVRDSYQQAYSEPVVTLILMA